MEAYREFGIDYAKKLAFATSESLFSVTFGRIVQRSGEEHEDVSSWSDAGVYELRISMVWYQFQFEVD